ncbi:precorrin-2 C(20)-methyltransferase [Tepidimonas aquatica]|uniref:Precorrin-2 C(20)-methyltransferase n=1 Tax=Tepidimonas aquatica TaxID=247482 RepID=A0A554WN27_9BURK|nr:precorrin-2 C(20)-methyltransferase [Tepidimonas aquatica]TSE24982.1 Precorrin-2 C(20)-methyltransferase [Tepidimonas aquatica]
MGRIVGVGLGPGDPQLVTVRAQRWLSQARQVAYFRKPGRPGRARRIALTWLAPQAVEHAMEYPVTTELPFDSPAYIDLLARFYDHWVERLEALAAQNDVVVLCEGDPFFYGSFMHLYERLRRRGHVPVEVVPGLPGMVGCWSVCGQPMTWGDDVLTILMGTLPEDDLVRHMQQADALVVMKVGRHLGRVRRALQRAGLLARAWLVQEGTMNGQQVQPLASVDEQASCPYFALVLVPGQGRRPEVEG